MSDCSSETHYCCDHCGLETPGEPFMQVDIEGDQLDMCCVGCACAAMILNQCESSTEEQNVFG